MKVVVNRGCGVFSLSDKAIEMIMKRKGLECFRYERIRFVYSDGIDEFRKCGSPDAKTTNFIYYSTKDLGERVLKIPREYYWHYNNIGRTDKDLIAVVEELGDDASRYGRLEVVDIPDNIEWEIDNYNKGIEMICEAPQN